jgi:lipopolysaccharide/colanic/teichoic acid biosynthesis glycosyltransferase
MTAQPIGHKQSSDTLQRLASAADITRGIPRLRWPDAIGALREALIRRLDASAISDARAFDDRKNAWTASPSYERSTRRILSAAEFRCLLERERDLANRGTRHFSLIVLRRSSGTKRGFERLSREVRDRLRSTDLIGRTASNRLEVLLTDTGPVGACVVADWIDRLVIENGIHVEPKLYVYPSVKEAQCPHVDESESNGSGPNGSAPPFDPSQPFDPSHRNGSSNGNGHANGNGHRNGNGRANDNGGHTPHNGNGHGTNGHSNPRLSTVAPWDLEGSTARRADATHTTIRGRASIDPGLRSPNWPLEDLWGHLAVGTPFLKRCLDVTVASIALVLLAPLFVAVAVAIKLDSPGPVIFKQKRAGRSGRPFVFYKFRSMFIDAEKRRAELAGLNEQSGPIFKIKNDPRMTRVGRVLRRWSVDELPQLWNVIKGDLSLVGPRSPTFDEYSSYSRWERQRLCVTGGITCIWQVSGRSQISFREWMRMDMRYLSSRGLWFDLCLLAKTIPAVVSGRGAY